MNVIVYSLGIIGTFGLFIARLIYKSHPIAFKLVLGITIIVYVIAVVLYCHNETRKNPELQKPTFSEKAKEENKNNNFIINANKFRPHIIVDSIQISVFSMKICSINPSDSIVDISGNFSVNATLTLRNIGNAKGNMRILMTLDSPSFSNKIRADLLEQKNVLFDRTRKPITRHTELLPEETKKVNISPIIQNPIDNKFNLHIFMLYTNDLKNLFDTYHWYEYYYDGSFVLDKTTKMKIGSVVEFPLKNIKLNDSNKSSKIYNKDEADKAITTLKKSGANI